MGSCVRSPLSAQGLKVGEPPLRDLPSREHAAEVGTGLLPDPLDIAPALKRTEPAVIAGPRSVALSLDRNATCYRLSGLRQQTALMID